MPKDSSSLAQRLLQLVTDVPCPVCDSRKSSPWRRIKGWKVDRCQHCGMKFVNPCPTEEALTLAYSLPKSEYDQYFQSDYLETGKILDGSAPWQCHYAHQYLGEIEKRLGFKGRVFELGCGSGIFLEVAQKRGWETAGVDFGDWRQDHHADQALNIQRCSIFDCAFEENYFDVIYMSSVFEHLRDPKRYLAKSHSLLKKGGALFLTGVPNVHSLTILLGVDRWIGNHPPIHLQFFSPKTAADILGRGGFHNIEIKSSGLSETILEVIFNKSSNKYSGEYASLVYQNDLKGVLIRQLRSLVYQGFNILGVGSVLEILARK